MKRIIATVALGLAFLGCYGPGKGVNPDHPPRPIPQPTAGQPQTTPPVGRKVSQVTPPICRLTACRPVPVRPLCRLTACRPV